MTPALQSQTSQLLLLARQEALKSPCLRAQVGAVIANTQAQILSTGFNSPPTGIKNSQEMGFCNKEKYGFTSGEGYHVCRSIHAEQYAILKLGIEKTVNASMFVFGHSFICNQCKQYITLAQIQCVILQKDMETPPLYIDPAVWVEELSMPQKDLFL